jgi:hypothetical protein
MSNMDLAMMADGGPDDLPRTLRREREAREAAARERQPSGLSTTDMRASSDTGYREVASADAPVPAAVTRFDVPFLSLVGFFLKAVLAAIPAIILLGVILWFGGQLLETFFPELIKMKILISFPN